MGGNTGSNPDGAAGGLAEFFKIMTIKQNILLPTLMLPGSLFLALTANAQLTSEHVADKIVTHGYSLIDNYVKNLPGYTCSFPNGIYGFTLANKVQINISPACIYGKIWRTITFGYPDNSVEVVVLDGPVSGEPGTPNEGAIINAKNVTAENLLGSEMKVEKIFKDDVKLNLSLPDDVQIFFDKMFASIEHTPISTGPEPTSAVLPKGTLVTIDPDEDKAINKEGNPTSLIKIKTKVDFKDKEKEIEISVDKVNKKSKIEIENRMATTDKKMEIKGSKLYVQTSAGSKEIKILPGEASAKATAITKVNTIELKEESQQPIYSVNGTKQAKLLFVIPVSMQIETKVSAESGNVISIKKPWWSFLTR